MTVRICAWCKRVLGHVEPYEDHSPTHGMCLACSKEYFPDDEEGGDVCSITDNQKET